MEKQHSRHIIFNAIDNFRDLGGYCTQDGKNVAWRRVFRSGSLLQMTGQDKLRLQEEFSLKTVIDLRNPSEQQQQTEITLLDEIGAKYYNVPFRVSNESFFNEEMKIYKDASDISEMYLYRIKHGTFGKRLVEALEAISRQENLPLLFHCGVGKDRTGVLTAFLLTLLGVSDDDIIADYALTDPFMDDIRTRIVNDPATPQAVKDLPDFDWRARPESMELFLTALRGEYGSIEAYIKSMGAKTTLAGRLKRALLV